MHWLTQIGRGPGPGSPRSHDLGVLPRAPAQAALMAGLGWAGAWAGAWDGLGLGLGLGLAWAGPEKARASQSRPEKPRASQSSPGQVRTAGIAGSLQFPKGLQDFFYFEAWKPFAFANGFQASK